MGVAAEHEAHAPQAKPRGDIGEAMDEEPVVTLVGALDERIQPEEHNDGFPERIAELDRDVERWVVRGTLGALHPVHDAATVGIGRPLRANGHARIIAEAVAHSWVLGAGC